MSESANCCVGIALVVVGIGVLLTIILVPMSFSGIEYYEYGFKRQKSTGTVKTDRVYDGGKYMIGPDFDFKTFSASAHFVSLDPVLVFTWDKLEIKIDVFFQYFLRKEDLPLLHKFYDLSYEPTIITSAIAALKVEAPKFQTRQFITDRLKVEDALFTAVRKRLGGNCCSEDCTSWKYACPDNCIHPVQCDREKKKGLWVDVKYFQMGKVQIPHDVEERFLTTLTLQEEVFREEYLQDASVERKDTEASVRDIKNKAFEIKEAAEADSQRIKTISQANYTATVEKARSEGLKNLYRKLGITDQATKSSFDYLRTLRGLDNVHFTVDFQQRIVGGGFGSN